jgi:hypothetical protein
MIEYRGCSQGTIYIDREEGISDRSSRIREGVGEGAVAFPIRCIELGKKFPGRQVL